MLGIVFFQGCDAANPLSNPNVTGSGVSGAETRTVSSFSTVEQYGVGIVTAVPGEELTITIEADDNMLQYAKTDVVSEKLRVGVGAGTYVWKTGYPRFRIPSSKVNSYVMDGQTWLELKDLDKTSLSIKTTGQCSIMMTGKVNELTLDLAGQTTLDATSATIASILGKVDGQSIVRIDGEADLKASVNEDSKIERVDKK